MRETCITARRPSAVAEEDPRPFRERPRVGLLRRQSGPLTSSEIDPAHERRILLYTLLASARLPLFPDRRAESRGAA